MNVGFAFFFNSILLGVGLAMDAFSVSLANGLNEPKMKKGKMFAIAGVFAFFQFAMPMLGWLCVSTAAHYFELFEKFIPYISLVLLCFIGGKMLYDSIKNKDRDEPKAAVGLASLLIQGVATSIDALSVGFTIADYSLSEAFISSLIIAVVTLSICLCALVAGKKAGTALAGKAGILGGSILIFIGIEIFIKSMF